MKKQEKEPVFWADKIAREIIERKKFRFVDKKIPEFKEFVVKTSASISGVLHIGRLSDTIRGESVYRALKDAGKKAKLIWVAEDMDPLRKIPEGVPEEYRKYIGTPVTDIPDPWGCHATYGIHHTEKYFEVLDRFVSSKMSKFSMKKEYENGGFRKFIKAMIDNMELVKEIQNKYRTNPLKEGWSPWTPICKNCGKIITPRIKKLEEGIVYYKCEDYRFEKEIARGCGFKGEADPLKDRGKLLWKGEWASQWARWSVVSEGAGKEYQVPLSAFWVNAELCEKVLDFPSPVPVFYEHLMIDGRKMSASLGNVIYPHQWIEVADPEILRYFYSKRLMKTRSFSWKDLPKLYDEYDRAGDVYFGIASVGNEKEREHIKRLFEISQLGKPEKKKRISYEFASLIGQLAENEKQAAELLRRTGHIKGKITEKDMKNIFRRAVLAANWAVKYAEKYRISLKGLPEGSRIPEQHAKALKKLAKELREKDFNEEGLYSRLFEISREFSIEPKDFFRSAYLSILGRDSGPRLARFILAVGKEKIADMLERL